MFVCTNSIQPWSSTQNTHSLIQHCRTAKDVNQIHAHLITTGFINKTSLATKLVLAFSSSPLIHPLVRFARHVFFLNRDGFLDRRNKNDPFVWNSVIKTYSHGTGDDPKQAFALFCVMLGNGVCVDEYSVSLVLKACSVLGFLKEGMQIHGLILKITNGVSLYLENCLIGLYLRCGCLGFAHNMFDRMLERDSVSYNSMIDGYIKSGNVSSARGLFDTMPINERNLISWNSMINGHIQSEDELTVAWELFEKMPKRDLVSWNSMICGYAKYGRMEKAQSLFDYMPTRDVVSWVNMIDGYVKLGNVNIARSLFSKMPVRDVVACNAMITGYAQNGFCNEALKLFHYMKNGPSLVPDNTTLLIVLSAIAQLGHLREGIEIHRYIEERRHSLCGKLGVALIDMYSKCGNMEKALRVFNKIEDKTVDHWNAMIGGLAVHGYGELALELFTKMATLSVKPDDITFIGVLNACGHAGLVKEGLLRFELMRRVYKVEPKLQHYGCMVDILGRAGLIGEAIKFIKEMPIKPNNVIWRTLLSACKKHENLKIGEPVAKHLIDIDSRRSSSYVLLHSIYAGSNRWNDVIDVRRVMKERSVKRIPGCSCIELEGTVHKFIVRDESHPQAEDIHTVLDSLCRY